MSAAKRFAAEIEKCSPVSIRTSLDVVRRGIEHASVEEAMLAEYESVTVLRNSEDMIEGPSLCGEAGRTGRGGSAPRLDRHSRVGGKP